MFHIKTTKFFINSLSILILGIFRKNCSFKIKKSVNDNVKKIQYPHEKLPNCENLSKEQVVQLLKDINLHKQQVLEDNERLRNELFKKECKVYLENKKKKN